MISNKKLKLIKRGIQEELTSPNSFVITDKYRFYTTIMYWWYIQYGSNSLSDYILTDIADQWASYFRNGPSEVRPNNRCKRVIPKRLL